MFAKGRAVYVGIYSALVLSLVHQTEEVQDLMSDVSCYTDYMTDIHCHWTENAMAMSYIPMDLYYERKSVTGIFSPRLCIRTDSPKPTSSNRCVIKEDMFAIGFNCLLIFKPKKPVNLRKSFNLLENIKLQAPFNLTVNVTETGDYKLSWESRYMGNSFDVLLGTLQYEVDYKQSWESWEDSLSETVASGSRHLEIRGSGLVPAGTYAARVRVRPQHCSSRCVWSAWSAEVPWSVKRSQPNPQAAEAEVMPRNLQCFFDGLQEIECTWEVTKMSSDLFTFNLHYGKATSSETQVCNSSVILREDSNFTVHGCNIHVRDRAEFEEYEVSLQLVEPSVVYHPYQTIRPNPPYNLTMNELPDRRLQLCWKSIKTLYELEYQVSYKKVDRPWEKNKTWQIPFGNNKFNLPKDSLDPSSRYRVRMQAKVKCSADIYSYCGIWSGWSQSVDFDTNQDKESLIIVACSLMIFLIIVTPIAALVIKRKKKMWLAGIPDPAKSQLFHKGGQSGALRSTTTLETASMEEGSICKVVTADSLTHPPQIIPREQSKYQMKEDKHGHSSPPVSGEGDKAERIYQGFEHEPGEVSAAEHANPTSLTEPSDYNGPYLFNFQDVSTLLGEFSEPKTTAGERANRAGRGPEPPGYVELPPTARGGVGGTDQFPPAPGSPVPAAYILIPPAPASNANGAIHAPTQEEPSFPSFYVMSMPPTNATPIPSSQVVPDCKATDISLSGQQGPHVAGLQSAPPTQGVDPLSGGKDATAEHGRTSPDNISPDHPMVDPWPATSGGYVSTPPAEQMAPLTTKHQDPWLPADPQHGERSQPPMSKMDAHQAPRTHSSTKPQVDLQKTVAKEAESPHMDTASNEASELILFQSGANPILFRQIGDYCFLPGSLPTKGTESTKGHVSSTKPEPSNKSLDSLEKQPPLQHSPSPPHHIACS
ncbi:cytokine receptor common subunit beta isoform X1 [Amblyraja radiata]|uniref:cytokine receptor common subunit beta isoform X1 n=1 Tax=Amblyraja radiata TaxID=386614 RepID=UPI0014041D8F|nr:cytokine receptor common subunit beta isoform X1 [Amblyraja radiata]XP_032868987.1 cytokine receptor common subunit beta isoform X1 [Amblyraja radiata]XP_032868988.1 cytokine receptor common subunit beta isoform X1 [Amblyraja radiata]